jgi:hypothetical protein
MEETILIPYSFSKYFLNDSQYIALQPEPIVEQDISDNSLKLFVSEEHLTRSYQILN